MITSVSNQPTAQRREYRINGLGYHLHGKLMLNGAAATSSRQLFIRNGQEKGEGG